MDKKRTQMAQHPSWDVLMFYYSARVHWYFPDVYQLHSLKWQNGRCKPQLILWHETLVLHPAWWRQSISFSVKYPWEKYKMTNSESCRTKGNATMNIRGHVLCKRHLYCPVLRMQFYYEICLLGTYFRLRLLFYFVFRTRSICFRNIKFYRLQMALGV